MLLMIFSLVLHSVSSKKTVLSISEGKFI